MIRSNGDSGVERDRQDGAAEELLIDERAIEKRTETCHILVASEAENEVRDHAAIAKGNDIARRVEDGIFRLRVSECCSNLGETTSVRRRRRRNALRQGKKERRVGNDRQDDRNMHTLDLIEFCYLLHAHSLS